MNASESKPVQEKPSAVDASGRNWIKSTQGRVRRQRRERACLQTRSGVTDTAADRLNGVPEEVVAACIGAA
jgi:hypothetical protein